MSGYTKRKDQIISWFEEFYTHHKGYRLELQVEPAGNRLDHRTYLSVILFLTKGPYDDHLKWPFQNGNCVVTLLNHIGNYEHYSETMTYSSKKRIISITKPWKQLDSNHRFIKNKNLHHINSTWQYIRDDTMYFGVDCNVKQ